MSNKNSRVLGRGLSALISGAESPHDAGGQLGDREARMVRLDSIGLNPHQPRKIFNDRTLTELKESIQQVGVLQPVLIRQLKKMEQAPLRLSERLDPEAPLSGPEPTYCLVAGERRVRAAHLAGIEKIPAIICSYEETESLKVALLENIQRENLNPMEEALAFQRLLDGYGATQEELSIMLGKSRSGITNTIRLLGLEQEIQDMLQEDQISRGHAKVLLGVTDGELRLRLARLCRNRGLSVRDCEKKVQALLLNAGKAPRKKRSNKSTQEETREIRALRERTEAAVGTPVSIDRDRRGRGSLTLKFYSDDDLMRLLSLLGVDTDLS